MKFFDSKFNLVFVLIFSFFLMTPKIPEAQNDNKNIDQKIVKNKNIKLIQGLYGKPRTLAEIWLKSQTDFISLKFVMKGKSKFFSTGILSGTLINGEVVSIQIHQDFFSKNPGMIHDHLRALRHRAKVESFSKEELKNQFILNSKFKVWTKEGEGKWDKKRKQEINDHLIKVLHEEISTEEASIVSNFEKQLEPIIRKRLIHQIENEIKNKHPGLAPSKIEKLITKEINKELNNRLTKELEDTILNKKTDVSSEGLEAKALIYRVLSKHRSRITTEINSKYAIAKVKRIKAMKKRFSKEGRLRAEKEKSGLFEKFVLWIGEKLEK